MMLSSVDNFKENISEANKVKIEVDDLKLKEDIKKLDDGIKQDKKDISKIDERVTQAEIKYAHNMVENPGPLAEMRGNPALNFLSGKYNVKVLDEDIILYRSGKKED